MSQMMCRIISYIYHCDNMLHSGSSKHFLEAPGTSIPPGQKAPSDRAEEYLCGGLLREAEGNMLEDLTNKSLLALFPAVFSLTRKNHLDRVDLKVWGDPSGDFFCLNMQNIMNHLNKATYPHIHKLLVSPSPRTHRR